MCRSQADAERDRLAAAMDAITQRDVGQVFVGMGLITQEQLDAQFPAPTSWSAYIRGDEQAPANGSQSEG
jgi:hypothetical protein